MSSRSPAVVLGASMAVVAVGPALGMAVAWQLDTQRPLEEIAAAGGVALPIWVGLLAGVAELSGISIRDLLTKRREASPSLPASTPALGSVTAAVDEIRCRATSLGTVSAVLRAIGEGEPSSLKDVAYRARVNYFITESIVNQLEALGVVTRDASGDISPGETLDLVVLAISDNRVKER